MQPNATHQTTGYILWHRADRRRPWGMVAHAASERDAWRQVNGSGDWLVLSIGKQP